MERGSLDKLKFDKRLNRRNGWISQDEVAADLDNLPDASGKIAQEEAPEENSPLSQAVTEPAGPASKASFGAAPVIPEAAAPSDEV